MLVRIGILTEIDRLSRKGGIQLPKPGSGTCKRSCILRADAR
jgi:hypothetical protein